MYTRFLSVFEPAALTRGRVDLQVHDLCRDTAGVSASH